MPLRLPDLPNAGYASQREKQRSDEIMIFMRAIERDRFRLLTIVLDGREKWRKAIPAIWKRADDDIADAIFNYFTLQACPPSFQARLLKAQKNPDIWKLIVHEAMPHIEAAREQARLAEKWSPFSASRN